MTISKHQATGAVVIGCVLAIGGFSAEGKPANPKTGGADVGNHVNKGVELAQQKQYDAAIAEFTLAIKANPKNARAYLNRGTAYRAQQKYSEAMADYNRSLQAKPDPEVYAKRGYTYVTYLQEYEKGIADYKEALRLNPNDYDTSQRLQYAEAMLAAKNAPPPTATPTPTPAPGLLTPMNIGIGLGILVILIILFFVLSRRRGGTDETDSSSRIR